MLIISKKARKNIARKRKNSLNSIQIPTRVQKFIDVKVKNIDNQSSDEEMVMSLGNSQVSNEEYNTPAACMEYFGMTTEEEIRKQAIMYEPGTSGSQVSTAINVDTAIEPEPEKDPKKVFEDKLSSISKMERRTARAFGQFSTKIDLNH